MPRPTPPRVRFALAAIAAVLVVVFALPDARSQSPFGGQDGQQRVVWICTRCGKEGDGPGKVCRYCTSPNVGGKSSGPMMEVTVDTAKSAERAGRAGKILGIAIGVIVLVVLVLGYSGRLLRAATGAPRPRRRRRNWYDDE